VLGTITRRLRSQSRSLQHRHWRRRRMPRRGGPTQQRRHQHRKQLRPQLPQKPAPHLLTFLGSSRATVSRTKLRVHPVGTVELNKHTKSSKRHLCELSRDSILFPSSLPVSNLSIMAWVLAP
jgi:hypothetical protein